MEAEKGLSKTKKVDDDVCKYRMLVFIKSKKYFLNFMLGLLIVMLFEKCRIFFKKKPFWVLVGLHHLSCLLGEQVDVSPAGWGVVAPFAELHLPYFLTFGRGGY